MRAPQLAISNEFLDALGRLPKKQKKKVQEFTKKFRADPTAAAINYEKIHNMDDDRVRTVRIDQKYRAVVLHPDKGNIYVLMWVDNHDEAMDWARNRRFEVHPETNSLQVLNVEAVSQTLAATDAPDQASNELIPHDDGILLSFGIPPVLLPAIRGIRNANELSQLHDVLPEEAYEALVWLADGESVEAVRDVVGMSLTNPAGVDESSSEEEASITNVQASRRILHVGSANELEQILDAPLERWRVFLHPHQRQLAAQSFSGPTLVLGGAGTGKTIVAMHRARHLASQLAGDDRVLLTTFTKNLAENVEAVMKTFCGDEFDRIDVKHLHEHAMSWLTPTGKVNIATDDDVALAWDQAAMDVPTEFDADFLRAEWFYAFKVKGIIDRESYLKVSRIGRVPSLSRRQRATVWKAFEAFHEALRCVGKVQWWDVTSRAADLSRHCDLPAYRYVIVDEGQDLTVTDWRFVRSLVKPQRDDLFVVADPRQRIYHQPISLSDGGIEVADRIHRLQINYRTTEQIRTWATERSGTSGEADLCDASRSEIAAHSLLSGPDPELYESADHESESKLLANVASELTQKLPAEEIAIVVRANWLLKRIKAELKRNRTSEPL
ncbi:MAG: UvrD-helicase domain-containing protein [Candidatus Paceibacterota bacterium]